MEESDPYSAFKIVALELGKGMEISSNKFKDPERQLILDSRDTVMNDVLNGLSPYVFLRQEGPYKLGLDFNERSIHFTLRKDGTDDLIASVSLPYEDEVRFGFVRTWRALSDQVGQRGMSLQESFDRARRANHELEADRLRRLLCEAGLPLGFDMARDVFNVLLFTLPDKENITASVVLGKSF